MQSPSCYVRNFVRNAKRRAARLVVLVAQHDHRPPLHHGRKSLEARHWQRVGRNDWNPAIPQVFENGVKGHATREVADLLTPCKSVGRGAGRFYDYAPQIPHHSARNADRSVDRRPETPLVNVTDTPKPGTGVAGSRQR